MLIESRRSDASKGDSAESTPALLEAGAPAAGEFRCSGCGYGVIVKSVLPACPMCHGAAWEAPVDGSFARQGI